MRLALYQPEIPQNTGTLLRLAACMGVNVDIVRPCNFALSDRQLKRAGMDYMDKTDVLFHDTWKDYQIFSHSCSPTRRLVLLDTKATIPYIDFRFSSNDCLVLGSEGEGVPSSVYEDTDYQVLIPMHPSFRSLNVAISAAMVLGEALRQTESFFPCKQ